MHAADSFMKPPGLPLSRWCCGPGVSCAPNPAPGSLYSRPLNASITRSIAGCVRFFNLIQYFDRPPRYGRSRRFDIKPSSPMIQA